MRETWFLVGAGGFLGSVSRYAIGGLVQRLAPEALFPWGTLAVNVLGCLVIGFAASLGEARGWLGPGARALLLVGVLGGFTTFSSFGYETWSLVRRSGWRRACQRVCEHGARNARRLDGRGAGAGSLAAGPPRGKRW